GCLRLPQVPAEPGPSEHPTASEDDLQLSGPTRVVKSFDDLEGGRDAGEETALGLQLRELLGSVEDQNDGPIEQLEEIAELDKEMSELSRPQRGQRIGLRWAR